MDHKTKRHCPTAKQAASDATLELLKMQDGDSLDCQRTFPGGSLRLIIGEVQIVTGRMPKETTVPRKRGGRS